MPGLVHIDRTIPNISVSFAQNYDIKITPGTKHLYYPLTLYKVTTFTMNQNVYITPLGVGNG